MSAAPGPDAQVIVRLDRAASGRFLEAPLVPPVRARPTARGLFLAGRLDGARALRRLRRLGAEVFHEVRAGTWIAVGTALDSLRERLPAAHAGETILIDRERRAWSVPPPGQWPAASTVLRVDWPEAAGRKARRGLQVPLRLEPCRPPQGRDGFLARRGEGHRPVETWGALSAPEIGELRAGSAAGWWWVFAPRGVPPDFPGLGRPLRNLGTGIEPVLIPADRAPRPRLSGLELRRLFCAEEGEGVIWWDDGDGENHVVFPRSALEVLSRDVLLRRSW